MRQTFLLLLLFPVLACAEVYKCKKAGSVTYSATPCGAGATSAPYDAQRVSVSQGGEANSAMIVRDSDGRYMTTGHADGQFMNFLVDTGATGLALPLEYAGGNRRLSCVDVGTVGTVGGTVKSCTVVVSRLNVAGFEFRNVRADFVPTLKGHALFGQDLLKHFSVTQRNGVMTISR